MLAPNMEHTDNLHGLVDTSSGSDWTIHQKKKKIQVDLETTSLDYYYVTTRLDWFL